MTTPEHPETVTVAYWAEFKSADGTEYFETYGWDEWAAMTTDERQAAIDDLAAAHSQTYGDYGGEVRGPEPEPAPDPPAMPPITTLAAEIDRARRADVRRQVFQADAQGGGIPRGKRREFIAEAEQDWDREHPALAAVFAHEQAAAERRRAAHERAKSTEQ